MRRSGSSLSRRLRAALLAGAVLSAPAAVRAAGPDTGAVQNPVDRADPSVLQRQLAPEEHRQAPTALPVAPLPTGRPVRTAGLERALLLAGDMPGVALGQPRIVRRNGRNILVVTTAFDRVQGRVVVDNAGSATAGPERARAGVDVNSAL